MMRAIYGGKPLRLATCSVPIVNPGMIRINVAFSGVNRADILQRMGQYPPPPGASEILGLEVSGLVEEIAADVKSFQKGDRVCALLSGGGHAEKVAVEASLCIKLPESISLETGAAIPENWVTAFQLCKLASTIIPYLVTMHKFTDVSKSDQVLIHASASGVGTALTQLCALSQCPTIIGIVGSDKKAEISQSLGATHTFNRHCVHETDIRRKLLEATCGRGIDVIFDCVGASSFNLHTEIAALDSRWILYGAMGGAHLSSVSLNPFLKKRISCISTTLRSRSLEYRSKLVESFTKEILPKVVDQKLKIVLHNIFDLSDAEKAVNCLEANANLGKVLLRVAPDME